MTRFKFRTTIILLMGVAVAMLLVWAICSGISEKIPSIEAPLTILAWALSAMYAVSTFLLNMTAFAERGYRRMFNPQNPFDVFWAGLFAPITAFILITS